MKIVIDVSLSPRWVETFREGGIEAVHWTRVGDVRAKDSEIVQWARAHQCVIFTNDLDFGTVLALTHASGPSVIQVRAQDVLPAAIGPTVVEVLLAHASELAKGAIITVDQNSARLRLLPIRRLPFE